jgi:hypothetical protein
MNEGDVTLYERLKMSLAGNWNRQVTKLQDLEAITVAVFHGFAEFLGTGPDSIQFLIPPDERYPAFGPAQVASRALVMVEPERYSALVALRIEGAIAERVRIQIPIRLRAEPTFPLVVTLPDGREFFLNSANDKETMQALYQALYESVERYLGNEHLVYPHSNEVGVFRGK